MHILLTDVLSCPRCGPNFGLVVLADRMEERRIVSGWLGCANCRESYPVTDGVVDLRTSAAAAAPPDAPESTDPDEAMQLAALFGITEGPASVLLLGRLGRFAGPLLSIVPRLSVIVAGSSMQSPVAGVEQVTVGGSVLPFRSGTLQGIALARGDTSDLLRESARLLAPGARLVVTEARPDVAKTLSAMGLSLLLDEPPFVVASAGSVG